MNPVEEGEEAALELCGCILGLIEQGCVPDHMLDYLQSRVARILGQHGLDPRDFKPGGSLRYKD